MKNKESANGNKTPEQSAKSTKEEKQNRTESDFPNYISYKEVAAGLKSGQLKKGVLRINAKYAKNAFVINDDNSQHNYTITNIVDRNRALNNDEVILKVKNVKNESQVVYIINKVHPRIAVGYLTPIEQNDSFALFSPRDKRFPKLTIHKSSWPKNFETSPEHFDTLLFLAEVTQWRKAFRGTGKIVELLGTAGNLKAETSAIQHEFSIDDVPDKLSAKVFLETLLANPDCYREDSRRRFVFTIDHPSTEDMDDALSCQRLPNGNFEVGVHIADASHYVKDGSEVDRIVRKKATSVYLVNACYNMLPDELCKLCSLSPGKDKFTFSVFWEITGDGLVVNKRAVKAVINSSCRLDYELAQKIIDKSDLSRDKLHIYNGYTLNHLSSTIGFLNEIANSLRERRRRSCGILKLKQPKVCFSMNADFVRLVKEETFKSHSLVEEFMILANMTVAERIRQHFPDITLLRTQPEPDTVKMHHLHKRLETLGIHIKTSSAKEMQNSLNKYINNENLGEQYNLVLSRLIIKYMPHKKYLCVGFANAKKQTLNHFSLGLSCYTHFTSPIRRYADIVTHRLLAATLNYIKNVTWTPKEIALISKHCNEREIEAQRAAAASSDLYLSHVVAENQPFVEDAVVYNVKLDCFDVVGCTTGSSLRVFANTFEEEWRWKSTKMEIDEAKAMWTITVTFPETATQLEKTLTIDTFTCVKIQLTKAPKANKLKAKLCRP